MTTPDNKKSVLTTMTRFFATPLAVSLLLLLPGFASADNFEISCRELNASPDKNLPAPYKAVWDGSILTQIAADSNGKIRHSSERVVAARRLPAPEGKGLKYSFVTGIHKTTKNRFLMNVSVEPVGNPGESGESGDFITSVSYATVDSDGFLIYAFEVVNEKCTLSDSGTAPEQPAAAVETTPAQGKIAPAQSEAGPAQDETGPAPVSEAATEAETRAEAGQ